MRPAPLNTPPCLSVPGEGPCCKTPDVVHAFPRLGFSQPVPATVVIPSLVLGQLGRDFFWGMVCPK